jgi:hypothetical protein
MTAFSQPLRQIFFLWVCANTAQMTGFSKPQQYPRRLDCFGRLIADLSEGVPELELSEFKRSNKYADAVLALWLAVREKRSGNC